MDRFDRFFMQPDLFDRSLALRVEDIDRRYEELKRVGAALRAAERMHWGTRWFVAKDPECDLIAFEQPDESGR